MDSDPLIITTFGTAELPIDSPMPEWPKLETPPVDSPCYNLAVGSDRLQVPYGLVDADQPNNEVTLVLNYTNTGTTQCTGELCPTRLVFLEADGRGYIEFRADSEYFKSDSAFAALV